MMHQGAAALQSDCSARRDGDFGAAPSLSRPVQRSLRARRARAARHAAVASRTQGASEYRASARGRAGPLGRLGALDRRLVSKVGPSDQTLVAREVRRGPVFHWISFAGLGLALPAFVALALLVRSAGILRVDVPIALAVQRIHWPLAAWALTHASDLGGLPFDAVSYLVVFGALMLLRLRLEAILCVAASLVADIVGRALKLAIGRTRPLASLIVVVAHPTDSSFPSGHVIEYVTLFGFACYIALTVCLSRRWRYLVVALLVLLIVLVGPSRVYLGKHWPSDVVGAYLFAGVWLAATVRLHRALKRRQLAMARREAPHGRPAFEQKLR
jgi:undecaprenyl-diphosphatase